jgi:hypothetical protein
MTSRSRSLRPDTWALSGPPAQTAAAGDFHPQHGDAGDPAFLRRCRRLFDDEALLAELGHWMTGAVFEEAPLKSPRPPARNRLTSAVLPLEERRRRQQAAA